MRVRETRANTSESLENGSTSDDLLPVKQRRRKTNLPSVANMLERILKQVNSGKNVRFETSEKSSRGLHNGTSKRRSQYIGVLKNGQRWQVLINSGKVKKYIGTFCDEKQAALVHDFYSIGLNGTKAKTNFSYEQSFVVEMIQSYFDNSGCFDPAPFVQRM